MRRSVLYCEPNFSLAGETNTWKFIYTTANTLAEGTKIKFDLSTGGRHFEWQLPQTKTKKNLIWGQMPDDKVVVAKQLGDSLSSEFEFVLPKEIKQGDNFIICVGSPTNDPKKGNQAQCFTQRRRSFPIYINPKATGNYSDPEYFHMDIRGNELKNIQIIVPSMILRNKRFDILVRFEDEYGNLTSNAPEGTLIDVSYDNFRETLNWKLFVPETGFITLPNLYFNEPGVYRIKLHNLTTKEVFYSSPIKCFFDSDMSLFWGLFHGESERVDSIKNIESCLRHYRDDQTYHFFGTSHFEHEHEKSPELWKSILHQIGEFNEEDRFSAFLGFHWVGENKEEGVRLFLSSKDNKPAFHKKDSKTNCLKKIYKTYLPKDWLSIPCFTMAKGYSFDFENHHPEFERVVEIYNAWGSSETTTKEGNKCPIKGKGSKSIGETPEGSIINALKKNCRFGFIAGGHDDRGIYQDLYDADQTQYQAGFTAVIAKNHNRASIFEALKQRSCYATTGARIILGVYVAKKPMGSELSTLTKPGLEFNRHISGYVVGTDNIKEVTIIRNGTILKTFHPETNEFEFTYDDTEHLSKATLSTKDQPPFVFYYMRVLQKDGHIAWSSPIWVDYEMKKESSPKSDASKALAT